MQMKWSKLKHRTESMFADSVRGRVQLFTTQYRGGESIINGFERRSWITIDGKPIVNMHRFLHDGDVYADHGDPRRFEIGLFTWWDLPAAAFEYIHMSVDEALATENTLIRAFAMLDRRLGRRRLKLLNPEVEIPLVAQLLRFRLEVASVSAVA